nr:hypothetical protein [Tanacetum cinerariifolium]
MWNTLKLADSKEVFRFMVDEKEVTFSLDELLIVLKLPQVTTNNNVEFLKPPELGERDMGIPKWLLIVEIMQTKAYKLYVDDFALDVLMTQAQPTESSQETHRALSALVQTSGSGISNLLAGATTFTGSGNLYCQWEHLTRQDREDKEKYEDPPVGLNQGLRKRKIRKDTEPPKGSKSKESKTSSFKGTKSQLKSSCMSVQEEGPIPPQKWISRIAQAEKPPLTFDELMYTPIDFSAYVMRNLKIDNMT